MAKPTTVAQYLASLPDDRRKALEAVRKVIKKHLPRGFEEAITYGMISYQVPLKTFGPTYNGAPLSLACLASQKNHMAIYLMCIYGSERDNKWFVDAYKKSGKKLDMGKACLRFKKLDDLALDVVGEAIARASIDDLIAQYQASRSHTAAGKRPTSVRATSEPKRVRV